MQHDQKVKRKHHTKWILYITIYILSFILVFGWFYSYLQFSYYTVRCGQLPVVITSSGKYKTYLVHQDKKYLPQIIADFACSESELIKQGYQHDPSAKEIAVIKDNSTKITEQMKIFDPKKINYELYLPIGKYRYSDLELEYDSRKPIDQIPTSTFTVKKDGYQIADLSQNSEPIERPICISDKTTICNQIVGETKYGNLLKTTMFKIIDNQKIPRYSYQTR